MKIKYIVESDIILDVDIKEISLLTIEEAKQLPKNIREHGAWWWLRSPGWDPYHAASVDYNGSIYNHGFTVHCIDAAVRPVLTIKNLDPLATVGDLLTIQGKKYVYIGHDRVLYNDIPIYHRFDEKTNDYEQSEIKQVVDNWLEERE